MPCPRCGIANLTSARFCSACGEHLDHDGGEQELGPRVLMATCHRCGETLPPDAYFSRGLNIAKLVALFPITFVLSILFFFLRKDRLVCGNCRKLLPSSATSALLPALQRGEASPLMLADPSGGLMLMSPEARQLAQASRRAKTRGVMLAMFALPFSLPAFAFMGDLAWMELAAVGLPGGLLVVGAVNAFRRSGSLQTRARESDSKSVRRQILMLAQRHQGRLTVAQVAASLGWDFKEAEASLDAMVDGRHVEVELTNEGRLLYLFPDLVQSLPPKPAD